MQRIADVISYIMHIWQHIFPCTNSELWGEGKHGSMAVYYGFHQLFLPEASWPTDIVIACVCVCLSVCQIHAFPRDNTSPVQAKIT